VIVDFDVVAVVNVDGDGDGDVNGFRR